MINFLKIPDKFLILILCAQPLFLMTIKEWSNALLILSFLYISILLLFEKKDITTSFNDKLVFIALLLPILAVLFSSALNNKWVASQFDAPARFLICIPIYIYLKKINFKAINYIPFMVAFGVIFNFIYQLNSNDAAKWGGRVGTYFTDPLAYSYISILFTILCAASIRTINKKNATFNVLMITAVLIGFYSAISTGSRSGWLAIPLVIMYFGVKTEPKKFLIILLASLFCAILFFNFIPLFNQRFIGAYSEISGYSFVGVAPETSLGLRITFLRIAYDMFWISPISGFGEYGITPDRIPSYVYNYASQFAIEFANNVGFHNEIVTNTMRSGIFGLISSSCVFILPFLQFNKFVKYKYSVSNMSAIYGIIFVLLFFTSSWGTEVFDIKYMASFYALSITLLLSGVNKHHEQ